MSRRPHFLEPLLGPSGEALILKNGRSGVVLARRIELAGDSASRRRGLLGRDGLPEGEVLVIAPCNAIHTFFMRFPIDVVFTDRTGRVLTVASGVKPWRMALSVRAYAALEFAAGAAHKSGTQRGDPLILATD